ncbi:unnamed protein product [Lymnaea stagnalis]|uniref:NmrA-like family domain-containing protein 1 n=1 Tax=Lymnaea stagnalis TaxID=6523 RepID=A0AAV2ICZ5_LYMST
MSQQNVVVVFGVNGRQGGAVATALAQSGQYCVRGIATDAQSSTSQELREAGVDVVNLDLNDRDGVQNALRSADACFITTTTDFDDPNCLDTEIAQGCLMADHCLTAKVQHVIFSTQLHSYNVCSLMARHLVAKAEIEKYMRDLGLPLTCLIVPVCYESVFDLFRPKSRDAKQYDIEIPMGTMPLDMISVDDLGSIVLSLLQRKDQYLDKTLSVCGDKITVREIAGVLNKYLRPKTFKDKQLTVYDFSQKNSSVLKGCTDWANMFQFFQRVDQRYNLSVSKQLNPKLRSFDQWAQENAAELGSRL